MSPLETAWFQVNLQVDTALNTSLIADPGVSYIAITALRVLVIGLCVLAVRRVGQLIRTLPARKKHESLRAYFRAPWWHLPALMITFGISGLGLMLFLQTLAGNLGDPTHRLGNLTPFLILANAFLSSVVLGITLGAGAFRRQVNRRRPQFAYA